MITSEQFNGLNFKKIREHSKEIEEYDGFIPLLLYDHIRISNRIAYLKKVKKDYEYKNMKEYRENFNLENEINILIDFVNQNPQFESIVKTKG